MRLTFLLLLFCQSVFGQISPAIIAVTTQRIPSAQEAEPTPLSDGNILADFALFGNDITDISGTANRSPRNLFGLNTTPDGNNVTYPLGTGGQSIAFSSSTSFTICMRFKSTITGGVNVLLSNEDWGASYKGIRLMFSSAGNLSASLYSALNTQVLSASMGALSDVNGNSVPPTYQNAVNDGRWHFIALTYNGTFGSANLRLYVDKTLSATTNNTQGTDADIVSIKDWKLGGRPNTTESNNIDYGEVIFYNVAKTHTELVKIEDGFIDTTGLQRYYKHEEEDGATVYNHYVTDYAFPYHGAISGTSVNTLRVSVGSTSYASGSRIRSHANKLGYTLSGSAIIPVNLADTTKTIANGTPTYTGKVAYPVTINSTSPVSFDPNPNGYDELNNVGLTSSTTITSASTEFRKSEHSNPRFKNVASTRFLVSYRELRHFAGTIRDGKYTVALDEIAPYLNALSLKTYLIWQGGQSNAVGSNTVGVGGDFVDATYKNQLHHSYLANNLDGTSTQSVTTFQLYKASLGRGPTYGPDPSLIKDIEDAGYSPYLYKYAIGGSSLLANFLNYWHPTDLSGAGIRLYPLMIPGLQDAISVISSTGRQNIEVMVLWDQGEANNGVAQAVYQTAEEELNTALLADIPEYNGIFVQRRLHASYAPLSEVRAAQDAFAAADPTKRYTYDSDAFATHDTGNVHLTIRGQEDSGQSGAVGFLARME